MKLQIVQVGNLYIKEFPQAAEYGMTQWEMTTDPRLAYMWKPSLLASIMPESAYDIARKSGGKVIPLSGGAE